MVHRCVVDVGIGDGPWIVVHRRNGSPGVALIIKMRREFIIEQRIVER